MSCAKDEDANFILNKRFRIKGVNTSINSIFGIFSSNAGMLGDIYLDHFISDTNMNIHCYLCGQLNDDGL